MVEIIGIIGALFAGLLADVLMPSGKSDADDEDGAPIEDTQDDDVGYGNVSNDGADDFLLGDDTDSGDDEGMPQSNDVIAPPDPAQTLTGGDSDDILFGLGGDDLVQGGQGNDILGGRGGDDTIFGDFGEDYMTGEDGDDNLDGGEGDDTIFGDNGADSLIGAAGSDVLYAGAGDDLALGGDGNDDLFGGEGNDTLSSGTGDDTLEGGLGDDILSGGEGTDEIYGDAGNDTLWGNAEGVPDGDVDFLNGGAGDDVLMLGAHDYGHGGTGADDFVVTDYGPTGGGIEITDYDPGEDQLIFVYDANLPDPPSVSLQLDQAGNTQVLVDGTIAVTLANGATIDLSEIVLRAE